MAWDLPLVLPVDTQEAAHSVVSSCHIGFEDNGLVFLSSLYADRAVR